MDETLSQIGALAKKFKQNKKLSNADWRTAKEQLQALLENPEYAQPACKAIPSLPSDLCCQAIVSAWKSSDNEHRERLVQLLLNEPAIAGPAGSHRKLTLVAAFISVDAQVALRVLIDLSCRLTRDGARHPGRAFAGRFWRELMVTRRLLEMPLGEYDITPREAAGIAAMVLIGMLESREADSALKVELVNWLSSCRRNVTLGMSLIAEAEKTTRNWPEDLQRRCESLGLIKTVSYRIAAGRTAKPAPAESKVEESSTPAPSEPSEIGKSTLAGSGPAARDKDPSSLCESRELKAALCRDLNVEMCLKWLRQHVAALENENANMKKKLDALENECHRERMRYLERERQLTDLKKEQHHQEFIIQDLRGQVSVLQEEKQKLTESLQGERLAREEEVERLKKRIDLECNYVLDEFRNKLLDRLSQHYRGYLEAREKLPTGELAEYLKYLVERVFRELGNHGIRLDGER